jgi:hypothetical protein
METLVEGVPSTRFPIAQQVRDYHLITLREFLYLLAEVGRSSAKGTMQEHKGVALPLDYTVQSAVFGMNIYLLTRDTIFQDCFSGG